MTKYSSEFKIKIVQEYLKGQISYPDLANKYKIPDKRPIREWVKNAEEHGLASLRVKRCKRSYSIDYKLDVVNYVKTREISRLEAAVHFGISSSQVNSWMKIFEKNGAAGLRERPRGRPSQMSKHSKNKKSGRALKPSVEEKYKEEIIKLKAQLHEAEMDRDILKALTALRRNQSKH